ncbi:protein translocase subunit SecDF [Mycoplasmopsis phocirhinis]|uniref:Protein translocase subunit SecDF n=1 Tax=Mycoplasmopsis phocirhinis TaxID=142650 RepID=A0A4P6MSP5_9BACT|nr:protein translocase subunit SecDF [Mycoplasmopsis phocirhinis]QBF34891.1 protein translocase subunit SecDF [Mycoplasmopsis phocirhinis]
MKKIGQFFKNIFSASTLKRFFTLSNWKRWFFSFFIVAATITTVVAGTTLYTTKNVKKSIKYGGGQEFLVSIENNNESKTPVTEVARSVQNRIGDSNNFNDVRVDVESDDKLKISKTGDLSVKERQTFEKLLTTKSTLIFTDISGQPLFRNGVFVEPNENNKINWEDVVEDEQILNSFVPPIRNARQNFNSFGSNNSFVVDVTLSNKTAEIEWTKATDYLSKKAQGQNLLLTWLNIDDLINIARNEYLNEWIKANKNPYNFVYVNETPDQGQNQGVLKTYSINADNYLINKVGVNTPLRGESFSIPSSARGERLTDESSKKLAENIKFGIAKYDLKIVSSNFISANETNNAYLLSLIAIGVIFVLIAIMFIVNYGLLGALSTISMALYLFITMLMFTTLRGEYSPIALASVMLGLLIFFNSIVLTYSRLKQEIYRGEKMRKALATTMRSTLSTLFDSNIVIILISFMLFYFGTQGIRTFSISLVFSIIGVATSAILLTRFVTSMLVNTKLFSKKPNLLGVRSKKLNHAFVNKFTNLNFISHSKWYLVAIGIFVLLALITFGVFAGINQNISAGFNRALEFQGGVNITIQGRQDLNTTINIEQATQIRDYLINNSANLNISNASDVISLSALDSQNNAYSVVIKTSQSISPQQISAIRNGVQAIASVDILSYGFNSLSSIEFLLNTIYAVLVALGIIFIYILIRFKWTYAIAVLIALIIDIILGVSFVALARIELNTLTIIAFAALLIISANDKIILISKIKEQMSLNFHTDFIEKEGVEMVANKAVQTYFKRSIYSLIAMVIIASIVALFIYPIEYSFSVTLIFGAINTVFSSIFITMFIWNKLESKRQAGIKKRFKNKYWVIPGVDEQIFPGINDFIA